jgi:hypothetical protein
VVGQQPSARASATFSAPIARAVAFALPTSAREVVALLGQRGDEPRRVDEEAGESPRPR